MRPKMDAQSVLEFPFSHLALTRAYYAKYKTVSKLLDQTPEIVALAHGDLAHALEQIAGSKRSVRFRYTSDNVLRVLLAQLLEGLSLREAVVRVDDSPALRQFTRLERKPMMDFTTLCKLKNAIRPATWKRINPRLAQQAVRSAFVTGEALRLDTTTVETNIHWPTDSTLLWDGYRVLARGIEQVRTFDPDLVGSGRLHPPRAKREALAITRQAVLWYKRLEKARFPWLGPEATESVAAMTGRELNWLLDGIDLFRVRPHEELRFDSVL